MVYLAIDPGNTTGWASYDTERNLFRFGVVVFENETITNAHFMALSYMVERADVVIYENFRLRPDLAKAQTGSEFFTVKVIGLIELMADNHPAVKFYKQEPSHQMAKARLEHVRLWNAPCVDLSIESRQLSHPRSALAHLANWVYKNDPETFEVWEQNSLQLEDLTCTQIRKRMRDFQKRR